MIRTVLIGLLFFLAPFLLYAGWLVVRRKNPLTGEHWTWFELASLSVVGLLLSVVLFGFGWQHSGDHLSGRREEPPAAERR
jgi:phosphoglycerol transferase MdoB-like AlkP superfamily enzyme